MSTGQGQIFIHFIFSLPFSWLLSPPLMLFHPSTPLLSPPTLLGYIRLPAVLTPPVPTQQHNRHTYLRALVVALV